MLDTFAGFSETSVENTKDSKIQTDSFIDELKDTSVSRVMSNMPYPEKVEIRQGLFPESIKTEPINDQFAYVHIDTDLYMPTYEGMIYFWERLSPGGYIVVHDFTKWDGIEGAVLKFCEEKKVGYFCLTDRISIAVVKPI